jgi:hypothetical protein
MIIDRRDVLFLIDKDKNEFYYNITYELDENINIHFLRVKINNNENDYLIQYFNPNTNTYWQDVDDAFNYILSGIQFIDLSLETDTQQNTNQGNV